MFFISLLHPFTLTGFVPLHMRCLGEFKSLNDKYENLIVNFCILLYFCDIAVTTVKNVIVELSLCLLGFPCLRFRCRRGHAVFSLHVAPCLMARHNHHSLKHNLRVYTPVQCIRLAV